MPSAGGECVSLIQRHLRVAGYVLTVILPALLRTRRRPVIFSRFAGLGDIISTFPAALELKKRHPHACFIYNCAASFACLPALGGVTERVTHLRPIGLVGHWYRWLLSGYYNFGSDDDDFTADHREPFLLGYARRQGVTVAVEHPRLQNRPEVLAAMERLREKQGWRNGPFVVLHPGPTWPVKQWPQASWSALVQQLRQRGVNHLVQLGSSAGGYTNLGASGTPAIPDVVSLVDKLSLEESLALISLADLFVGIDSGLLHAAVSFRVPAVGVWGATSPKFLFAESEARDFVVSPVACQGCHHRFPRLHNLTGCPHDIRCMPAVAVPDVLRACCRLLPLTAK
jgi:ADP-heptose:LPS heptosyltransferase